jgi:hypothetical protein
MTVILVLLALMVLGAVPAWPGSRRWRFFPAICVILLPLIILLLFATGLV